MEKFFYMLNENDIITAKDGSKEQTIYYFVEDLMLALNFRNNLIGRTYLRDCFVKVCLDDKVSINLTDDIYPLIAEHYSVTSANVCKAIRHCLITCQNDGKNVLTKFFATIL